MLGHILPLLLFASLVCTPAYGNQFLEIFSEGNTGLLLVGGLALILILRRMWKAYVHPAHTLGRQAANMNWVAAGSLKDDDGYKNMVVQRDGLEAAISFKNENVELLKPKHHAAFKDFIELERWLAQKDRAVQR